MVRSRAHQRLALLFNGASSDVAAVRRLDRLRHDATQSAAEVQPQRNNEPPQPPLALTPLVACSSEDDDVLWHIAREAPELRRWLIANPRADANLLEYVAQAGGPGVKEGFEVLFESLGQSPASAGS
ncbi:hypothetical protein [Bifidobacterium sp.]|jgi:hypothetical protein|uniref:variant leucine-rich repeat-containing protein n=1 Tax=Bifidobacterium sp. TaxID=41200 RepID=UPI0025B934D7|nr:hypothetical protein [Bifidobacterium sp.]MCH4209876.1 hypothetical protein [Bifidobacterium sp.]MCI1224487.1 hypothetical protein [Bifidobacterium sp.]